MLLNKKRNTFIHIVSACRPNFIQIICMQIDDRRLYSRFEGSQFPCQRHRSHHSLTPTNNRLTPPSQSRGHLPLLWIKKLRNTMLHCDYLRLILSLMHMSAKISYVRVYDKREHWCQSSVFSHCVRLLVDTEVSSKRRCQSTIFWDGVSRYAAIPLTVALSPGHSDITRFRPWSPNMTGNHLDSNEKIPKGVQTTGTVDVFDPRSGISGPTSRRASACPNLHEL